MEQQYLLTYERFIKESNIRVQTYSWFENQKDMENFIENSINITVIAKTRILKCEEL